MRISKKYQVALLILFFGSMEIPSVYALSDYFDGKTASIGPRLSYFKAKDADNGKWFGGAQARFYPFNALGLEASIDYRQDDFGPTRTHTFPVQASLLAYVLSAEQAHLYLLGGLGLYFTRVDVPGGNDDTDNRLGFHAGFGGEVEMNEYWSIDGTYRHIWVEEFRSRDANLRDKDFDDSGNMFTIGLNYHF
jgi:opacity protein-like surface antigen